MWCWSLETLEMDTKREMQMRPRQLLPEKAMRIYRSEDQVDLAALRDHALTIASGMQPDEEKEKHLQDAVQKDHRTIPVPLVTLHALVAPQTTPWTQPTGNIRYVEPSDDVRRDIVEYDCDEADFAFLENDAKLKGYVSPSQLECAMDALEKSVHAEPAITDDALVARVKACVPSRCAQRILSYWRDKRLRDKAAGDKPLLQRFVRPMDNKACTIFKTRGQEKRQRAGRNDKQAFRRLKSLREEMAQARSLAALVLGREQLKQLIVHAIAKQFETALDPTKPFVMAVAGPPPPPPKIKGVHKSSRQPPSGEAAGRKSHKSLAQQKEQAARQRLREAQREADAGAAAVEAGAGLGIVGDEEVAAVCATVPGSETASAMGVGSGSANEEVDTDSSEEEEPTGPSWPAGLGMGIGWVGPGLWAGEPEGTDGEYWAESGDESQCDSDLDGGFAGFQLAVLEAQLRRIERTMARTAVASTASLAPAAPASPSGVAVGGGAVGPAALRGMSGAWLGSVCAGGSDVEVEAAGVGELDDPLYDGVADVAPGLDVAGLAPAAEIRKVGGGKTGRPQIARRPYRVRVGRGGRRIVDCKPARPLAGLFAAPVAALPVGSPPPPR